MTIFGSIIYPDNSKRSQRVVELSSDCIYNFLTLRRLKDEIDLAAKDVAKHTRCPPSSPAWTAKTDPVDLASGWSVKLPYSVAQMVTKRSSVQLSATAPPPRPSPMPLRLRRRSQALSACRVGSSSTNSRWHHLGCASRLGHFRHPGRRSARCAAASDTGSRSAASPPPPGSEATRTIPGLAERGRPRRFDALAVARDRLLDETARKQMLLDLHNNYRLDLDKRMSERNQAWASDDLARLDAQRQSFVAEDA